MNWKDPKKERPANDGWVLGGSLECTKKLYYRKEYDCFMIQLEDHWLMIEPVAWTEMIKIEYPKFNGVFSE